MNPIEIENRIAAAIANRPSQKGKRYQLCCGESRVWCNPLGLLTQYHHVIRTFTNSDVEKGFTSEEWDAMAREILQIMETEERMKQDAENP